MGCSCRPFVQDPACSTHLSRLLGFVPGVTPFRLERGAVTILPPIVNRDPGDETDHVEPVEESDGFGPVFP